MNSSTRLVSVQVYTYYRLCKAQIPLRRLSPKLPRGESRGHKSWKFADTNGDKSWNYSWNYEVSVKVADTNHESREHKPSRHVGMFATKSMTSPRRTRLCRSNKLVRYNARGKSVTKSSTKSASSSQRTHESRRRDLCRGLSWFVSVTSPVRDFVGNLLQTLSQSRRNGIWA